MRRDHLRSEEYQYIKDYCCDHYLYSPGEKLYENFCQSFRCARCRPFLIKRYLNLVVKEAEKHRLLSHLIITLPGKEYRKYMSQDESFKDITKKWNLINNRYRKKFKKGLNFICFNRSTMDGYAHLHILTEYIKKGWLQEVIPKVKLGFFKIKYVDIQRIRNYLSKYWYKEHEWYIPKNKRHFSSSRTICLKQDFSKPTLYQWTSIKKNLDVDFWFNWIQYKIFTIYNDVFNDWYNWRVNYV